jgi:hypothetical protein
MEGGTGSALNCFSRFADAPRSVDTCERQHRRHSVELLCSVLKKMLRRLHLTVVEQSVGSAALPSL